jgi:hypothetical protein
VEDEEKAFCLRSPTTFPQADKPSDIADQDLTPFLGTTPSGWCFRRQIKFLTSANQIYFAAIESST